MHKYIEDTRFAAQSLIDLIRNLTLEAEQNVQRLDNHKESIKILSKLFMDTQFSERAMHDFIQLRKKIEETPQIEQDHERYLAEYYWKYSAAEAISGALLQIAKQGISYKFTQLDRCKKKVRDIGSQPLQQVIWYARNQSMHYEDGAYDDGTEECFDKLVSDLGIEDFAVGAGKGKDSNLALRVVRLLGWDKYEQYEKDMIGLLG